ncbi:unnamed protein product [Effrenium voratum]|uniref:BTB domain-containing protein n=1 Tax=Effrenium voratum TaxID=2562239 RepID=A0AA36MZH0_9DINO|nr:unnamed protein product [Effrenium voratum]
MAKNEIEGSSLERHNQWLLDTGSFSDVVLWMEGKRWQLHKNVLARSAFFRRMLTGNWSESRHQEIKLTCQQGLTEDGFGAALGYLYTSRFPEAESLEAAANVLVALKFLTLDKAVEDFQASIDTSLPCTDWPTLTFAAALYRETMPALWKVVLLRLAQDPAWLVENRKDIHQDVLAALVGHPALQVYRDISRYWLAVNVLCETNPCKKEVAGEMDKATCGVKVSERNPKRRRVERAGLADEGARNKLFATLPQWDLTSLQVCSIRQQGLVPDRLLLDWWEAQADSPHFVRRGFEVRIAESDVTTSIPRSWAHLYSSCLDTDIELDLTSSIRCPFNQQIPGKMVYFGVCTKLAGRLKLYCHLVLPPKRRDRSRLSPEAGLQIHTGQGSKAVFQQLGDSGSCSLGGFDVQPNTEIFACVMTPPGLL